MAVPWYHLRAARRYVGRAGFRPITRVRVPEFSGTRVVPQRYNAPLSLAIRDKGAFFVYFMSLRTSPLKWCGNPQKFASGPQCRTPAVSRRPPADTAIFKITQQPKVCHPEQAKRAEGSVLFYRFWENGFFDSLRSLRMTYRFAFPKKRGPSDTWRIA